MKKISIKTALITGGVLINVFANAQTYLINQDFGTASGTTPPAGWSSITLYSANAVGVDVWHFDNPGSRAPGAPMSNPFAVFDGATYSPANNALENVALESPAFSTLGVPTVSLSFDYAFGAGTGTNGFVESFDGTNWILITTITASQATASSYTLDISNASRNLCNAKVRFRWSANDGGWWAVDNVKVFYNGTPNTTDARVLSFEPFNGTCASSTMQFKAVIRNEGTSAIGNFPVKAEIFNGTSTTTITQNAPASIPPCSTVTVTFTSTANMSNAALTYNIKVYSELSGDQWKTGSDTVYAPVFNVQAAPIQPTNQTQLICGIGSKKVGIALNPGDLGFWYATNTATTPFFTGDSVTTPVLTADTTYYVETFRATKLQIPNPYTPVATAAYTAGGVVTGIQSGVYYDITASADIVVDSLEVMFRNDITQGPQTGQVMLSYRTGSYVGFVTTNVGWTDVGTVTVTGAGGNRVMIRLGGVKINKGQTVGFLIWGNTGMSLEFKTSTTNLSNSDLSLYSNTVFNGARYSTTGLNNFGFAGVIHYKKVCVSSRASILLNVKPKPKSDIVSGAKFQGTFIGVNSNSLNNPDIVKAGDTLVYEYLPPVGYTNPNYGSTWFVNSLEFKTIGGLAPATSDTLTGPPTASTNGFLRFVPSGAFTDTTFQIIFKVAASTGCDSIIIRYVYVAPVPVARFSTPFGCFGQALPFKDSSIIMKGSLTYLWSFGDPGNPTATSTLQNPAYTYSAPGTYTAKLRVTSNYGYADSVSHTVTIGYTPQPSFTHKNVCKGDSMIFKNTSTIGVGNTITAYNWNFGNGILSSATDKNILYNAVGSYNVTLSATSSYGCKDSITKTVFLLDKPVAAFTAPAAACTGKNVSFSNGSTLQIGNIGYSWVFGDGNTSVESAPQHEYVTVGTYTVKLRAYSDMGCMDSTTQTIQVNEMPDAAFAITGVCQGDVISFTNQTVFGGTGLAANWDFGDGQTLVAGSGNVTHSYTSAGTFTVTLLASAAGCSDVATHTTTIYAYPKTGFATGGNACLGTLVNFMNQTSNPSGGSISYTWDLGNSTFSADTDPNATYTSTGTFTVKLKAVSNTCADSISKQITVFPLPVINIAATNLPGERQVQFTPSATTYANYEWDFGDGSILNQVSPVYSFLSNGPFTVKLKVKDSNGCESETTKVVSFNVSSRGVVQGLNSFDVYPNPFKGSTSITYELAKAAAVSVKVFDMLGRELTQLENEMKQAGKHSVLFNTTKMQAGQGVYIVHLTVNGVIATKQLIEIK